MAPADRLLDLPDRFLIEERHRIDDTPNHKGTLLNNALTLVFNAADLSIGVMTAYYLKLLVDKIPG